MSVLYILWLAIRVSWSEHISKEPVQLTRWDVSRIQSIAEDLDALDVEDTLIWLNLAEYIDVMRRALAREQLGEPARVHEIINASFDYYNVQFRLPAGSYPNWFLALRTGA